MRNRDAIINHAADLIHPNRVGVDIHSPIVLAKTVSGITQAQSAAGYEFLSDFSNVGMKYQPMLYIVEFTGTWNVLTSLKISDRAATPVDVLTIVQAQASGTHSLGLGTHTRGAGFNVGLTAGKGIQVRQIGSYAQTVLTSDNTDVADGDTVTLNDITYRFKDTLAQAYDVKRDGTTADNTLTSLMHAINGTGTPGTDYHASTVTNPDFTSSTVASHALTLTAVLDGTTPNSYATTETSAHLSFPGATVNSGTPGSFATGGGTVKVTLLYKITI